MADERLELEKVSPDATSAQTLQPRYSSAASYKNSPPYSGTSDAREDQVRYIRDVLRAVRRRRWLIISIVLIITGYVTIEAYRAKSEYQASAIIEIGKESPMLTRTGEGMLEYDDPLETTMRTNMVVLKSPPLIEDVVLNLKLDQDPKFIDVTKKRSFWEGFKAIGTESRAQNQDRLARAVFNSTEARTGNNLERSPEQVERLEPFVGVILGNLTVEQIRDTRTMKLSFNHTDPTIAAAVANGVAQSFIDFNFQNKTQKFTKASDWLDRSTRELKAKVEEAEQALADYTRKHNIFSMDGKESLTTDKLSRLHEQATRAETDRILKESLFQEVKAGRVAQIPEAFADPKTSELQKKLGELTTAAAELRARYGPKHPKTIEIHQQIVSIQEQIGSNRHMLEEKLKADYERSVRDEQSLKAALARAKVEATQQNQDSIQFSILKQDVDTTKTMYTEFLHKTNQANLEVAEQQSNMRMIAPARPPKGPIGPNRSRIILIGFSLSLLAGVMLAYFLDFLDTTVKTIEDLDRYLQLPALAVIPTIGTKVPRSILGKRKTKRQALAGNGSNGSMVGAGGKSSEIEPNTLMLLGSNSSAAEAYRALRTSVLLSAAGHAPKTILVTSGQPSEGKTTTAINTAVSLANLGASVLLIDADLRRPSIHKAFELGKMRGLSTYLSRDVEINELIQKTEVLNLSLLPCGPPPPNPAELIGSERMKDMLRILAQRYDHILIDSPPLMHVTDPVILSTLVDGVILVVHGGRSNRHMVQRARQELLNVGAKIFGVVLNNIDLAREGYYDNYYYYRYYSTYGHQGEEKVSASKSGA
jgi:capsular exopolysaccharide synthesis family protein